MSNQEDRTGEYENRTEESGQEVRIYSKGEMTGAVSEAVSGRSAKTIIFAVIFAAAVFSIAFGLYKVWNAFREFDETILREKDNQFYSLISSEDINIETTLDAFCREAETFFARKGLSQLRAEWKESENGDVSALREYLASNTMTANPVYADMLMLNGNDIIISAAGLSGYTFLTEADGRGLLQPDQ